MKTEFYAVETDQNILNSDFSTIETSQIYTDRGISHFKLGNYFNALSDFNSAITLYPNNIQALNLLGILYYASYRLSAAFNQFDLAYQLSTYDTKILSNRAKTLYHLGEFSDSIKDFTYAIIVDPDNSTLYFNRAIVYKRIGKHLPACHDLSYAQAVNNWKAVLLHDTAIHTLPNLF